MALKNQDALRKIFQDEIDLVRQTSHSVLGDDIELDDNPLISTSYGGVWVGAYLYTDALSEEGEDDDEA